MATPVVGAVSTAMTIPTPGGSPRSLTIAIGEATPSKHRALVVWTNAGHSANAVSGITAGGAAMTALGMGGAGSTPQLAPYIITDPPTDGSGNCALSIALTGNGEYNVYVWWAVVDDIAASSPYTDLTAGGALGGSSNAPSTGAQTVPAGSLLLAGMIHNFSSSYSLAGTGSTEHMHGLFTSKPISIASRTTTGAVSWSTSSSNIWLVSALLIAGESGGGGATATTLTGPTSGTVGVASSAFTVGANGAITGTVTVTPNDGGAGGTFTPTSVAISSGTPTATFTYTPSSAGAKTISITNSGGLANPPSLTYTATSSATPVAFSGTVPSQGATVGAAFSLGLAGYFSGSLTPFVYSIQAGTLPAGLSLNSSTGVISGTPTTAGTSSGIVVRATDTGSNTADTNAFGITVAAAPAPVFTGPVSLLRYRSNGFDISYPAGDGTTVGYEVSTDAGGSYTSVGTSLAPTISTPLPGDPGRVRVRAFNSAGTRSAAVAVAQGVLGSTVPATGEFGAAALYAWLQANPSYLSSIVHAEVTRWPSLGTLVMNPDSSGTYTPAGDGEQSADIQPRVAGVATGTPFAIILRSGSGGGDTDPPVMQGEIAVSALTDTSVTTAVDPATDNVGVTGYQVSQDGGSTWIDKGLVRSHAHTGLSPQTTYPVRWRARDAAGNWATPLAKSVTTQAAPTGTSAPIDARIYALLRRRGV